MGDACWCPQGPSAQITDNVVERWKEYSEECQRNMSRLPAPTGQRLCGASGALLGWGGDKVLLRWGWGRGANTGSQQDGGQNRGASGWRVRPKCHQLLSFCRAGL